MAEFPIYKDFVKSAVMAKISELLAQCDERQREFYGRLYPNGPTREQMESAYELVRRTVMKNIAEPGRVKP